VEVVRFDIKNNQQYDVYNPMTGYQRDHRTHRAGHRCTTISSVVYTFSFHQYYVQLSVWLCNCKNTCNWL